MTTAEEPGAGGPGPPGGHERNGESERDRVIVRDKRRVKPGGSGGGKHAAEPEPLGKHAATPPSQPPDQLAEQEPAGGLAAELAAARTELDERTRDLQRVTAEYANYRRRVERDRALAADEATASVFRALLPVFDDLDRAREHGELADGVAAVVDQLVANAGKFGLIPFGEPGDLFDPNRHEAVAQQTSPEVSEPTCIDVLRRGYLLGDRLLRPAMVAVAQPGDPLTGDPGRGGAPESS